MIRGIVKGRALESREKEERKRKDLGSRNAFGWGKQQRGPTEKVGLVENHKVKTTTSTKTGIKGPLIRA